MAVFRQFPKGSAIGSGAYVFRHYGSEAPAVLNYLCFTAEEAGSTVSMSVTGSPTRVPNLETSTDGITWTAFTPGTTVITLDNVGDKVYFRGNNSTISEAPSTLGSNYYNFVMTGLLAGSGNIMSLLDKTCERITITSEYCFYYLFYGCASLTTAPELPATTLSTYCYCGLFRDCTGLTTTPVLPATALVERCYYSMFSGCTGLTTLPKLPAAKMKSYCYGNMFSGCSAIRISETQGEDYQYPWRIPTSGTGTTVSYWNQYMLNETGGTFTGNPSINTIYYTDREPV